MGTWDILWNYRQAFASGLMVSLELALSVWAIGLVFGTLLGLLAARRQTIVGPVLAAIGIVMTSIPILVLLFWLHYPLQVTINATINPFYTAVTALSIVNIFGVASIVQSAIRDFPAQYVMAGQVCGLTRSDITRNIVFPLVVRQMLPGILLLQVTMLQSTLFASLISVDEIFRVAQRVNAVVYRPIQIYTGLALLFLAICLPLNALAFWMKKRFQVLTSDQ